MCMQHWNRLILCYTAARTGSPLRSGGGGGRRSDGNPGSPLMTQRRNCCGLFCPAIARFHLLAGGGARRFHAFGYYVIMGMRQRINALVFRRTAPGTSSSPQTTGQIGRFFYNSPIAPLMSQRRHHCSFGIPQEQTSAVLPAVVHVAAVIVTVE